MLSFFNVHLSTFYVLNNCELVSYMNNFKISWSQPIDNNYWQIFKYCENYDYVGARDIHLGMLHDLQYNFYHLNRPNNKNNLYS